MEYPVYNPNGCVGDHQIAHYPPNLWACVNCPLSLVLHTDAGEAPGDPEPDPEPDPPGADEG